MSKLLVPLLGVGLFLWIVAWSWWFSNNYCGNTQTSAQPSLFISDGDFNTKSTDNFSFNWSSAIPSFSENLNNSLQSLAAYLEGNDDRQVTLSGVFVSTEDNISDFENLGKARAEAIKEKLVGLGAINENIITQGFRIDNTAFEDDKMDGGIYFTFDKKEEPISEIEDDRLNEEDDISLNNSEEEEVRAVEVSNAGDFDRETYFQPRTLYYKSSKYELDLFDKDLVAYLKSLRYYLRKNKERVVVIEGHTDNIGNSEWNLKLSEMRARKVRRFLVDSGVRRAQIELDYDGLDSPAAANDHEEGRKKNRRVEIYVK